MIGPGIAIHRAWVTVGDRALLADVTLQLRQRELIAIVGRNGAGKSTLLRLMAGFLEPSRGEVVLEGRPLRAIAAGERARRLGFLAPARLPSPAGYTVRQVVGWMRFAHHSWWRATGADDASVAYAIASLELTGLAERRLDTLSDGERQRVWLAGLVAQDTEFVLLDEPTSHLDPTHAIESLRTIRSWATAGRGVAIVLHDLDAALAVADRIVLVDGGRIAFDEPVARVPLDELGRRLGIRLAEITLDGRRRVLAQGLGGA